MPLQDRFLFRFCFILTVIFISLILVNPRRSFAGDATQDVRKSTEQLTEDDFEWADGWEEVGVPKLAEQGEAEAQYLLGNRYSIGYGVSQDYKEAVRWYQKAAEQGCANAQYNLGVAYSTGQGVPQDYKKAVKWYRKAAEQGDSSGQYGIGCMYYIGQGVPRDYKEAVNWLRKSAKQGDAGAQCRLARMYQDGDGAPQDHKKALYWFIKAAEQGNVWAQYFLGAIYKDGQSIPQNYEEAAKWYRKAAEQGNVKAQISLAIAYRNGDGVPQDHKKALCWFTKVAEQGNADAQYFLGTMYEFGQGVQDYKKAFKWYRRAAEQGNARGQCMLGSMYYTGQGVPQDYKEAFNWLRKSAKRGDAFAQYTLGIMYDKGQGVPQDYIRAYAWFNLAASQGNTDAAGHRNDLANTFMTPQQIAAAQEHTVELQDKIENRSSAATSETEKPQSKGLGTGFFITRDGYILTCYHVIEKANSVKVLVGDKMYEADIEQIDIHNDLSLLKIRGVFPAIAFSPARSAKLGESIFTIGYPNPVLQGYAAKLTRGEINSLSGCRDDPRLYQISAPVQPGNSGGALVDENGYVVGIVVAVLDERAALKITGSLPQNVNYAIKGAYALAFLDALPEVSRELMDPKKNPKKSFDKIVEHVKKCTVMVITY